MPLSDTCGMMSHHFSDRNIGDIFPRRIVIVQLMKSVNNFIILHAL